MKTLTDRIDLTFLGEPWLVQVITVVVAVVALNIVIHFLLRAYP